MLSKEVFKKELQKLVYIYPGWKFQFTSKEAVQALYSYFADIEDKEFTEMVTNYVINEKFPPTVASLFEYKGYERIKQIRAIRGDD